jgi:hypothetical protein
MPSVTIVRHAFNAHPHELGETYFQHQAAAFTYARVLLCAGLAALVHGILPCLFTTTASRAVTRLHEFGKIRSAGAVARSD